MVRFLVGTLGIDINAVVDGQTTLGRAQLLGNQEIIDALLEAGVEQ